MGVSTILAARRVVLMAWANTRRPSCAPPIEEELSTQVTASFLQEHDNAVFVLDQAAAGALTRFRAPWLLGPLLEEQGLRWDERMTRRAILWLAQERKKAILKLTDDDYNEAGLQDLLRVHGSAYEANRAGFYQLQHTITGWPGGRDPRRTQPGDAPVRPLRAASAAVFPKRVLILSPHPADDVVAMGGTLCRLVEHGQRGAHRLSGFRRQRRFRRGPLARAAICARRRAGRRPRSRATGGVVPGLRSHRRFPGRPRSCGAGKDLVRRHEGRGRRARLRRPRRSACTSSTCRSMPIRACAVRPARRRPT